MDAGENGHWQLIGDPTPLGWLTFAAYLVAAWVCWRAHRSCRFGSRALCASASHEAEHQRRLARWWLGLGALMFLLGLNKQLDLQTQLTELGKYLARAQGWYAGRKQVQIAFVAVLALGLVTVGLGVAFALRHVVRRILPALVGLILILCFVELRAAAFYVLRATPSSGPLTGEWILELAGIGLVTWGAYRAWVPTGFASA